MKSKPGRSASRRATDRRLGTWPHEHFSTALQRPRLGIDDAHSCAYIQIGNVIEELHELKALLRSNLLARMITIGLAFCMRALQSIERALTRICHRRGLLLVLCL